MTRGTRKKAEQCRGPAEGGDAPILQGSGFLWSSQRRKLCYHEIAQKYDGQLFLQSVTFALSLPLCLAVEARVH